MLNRKKFTLVILAAAGFFLVTALVAPLIGSTKIDMLRVWHGESPDHEIFFYARLPRVILAALTGGALALAGVIFQALLRDALATPFTLGVQSGSALGAVLAICSGWQTIGIFPATWPAAFIGAAITIAIVISIATQSRRMSSFTLLLTGVAINAMAMAAILFLHYSAGFAQSFAIVRWLMGGIESRDYMTLTALAVGICISFSIAMKKSNQLNLLSVGEEWAATRGVNLASLMLMAYLLGSFLTASVTAFTGPIGFIGLLIPHALRLQLGADHRTLIPASFLVGGGFLILCDTVARTAMAPAEIPVGVITALIGGPFFIWLLHSRRGGLWM